jgi:hypothetical protein
MKSKIAVRSPALVGQDGGRAARTRGWRRSARPRRCPTHRRPSPLRRSGWPRGGGGRTRTRGIGSRGRNDYQAWCRLSLADGRLEGVQDQFGAQLVGHRPARIRRENASQDHGQIQPALAGALLGAVGAPEPVGPVGLTSRSTNPRQVTPAGRVGWCGGAGGGGRPAGRARPAAGRRSCGRLRCPGPDAARRAHMAPRGPAAARVDLADLLAEQRIRVITVGRRAGGQA